MLACTVEKQKKDFINMNKLFGLLIVVFTISACKNNNVNPEPIDNVPVSITINMALPSYSHLLDQGTFVYEPGGVKGIVIVHYTDDNFYAFDRNCSYQPKTSCASIEVDSAVNLFRCGQSSSSGFQKCCDSRFWMNGEVFAGPATYGLKHYQVTRSGNLLNIKN